MAERAGLSCGGEVLALVFSFFLSFFQERKEGTGLLGGGEWRDRYISFEEKGGMCRVEKLRWSQRTAQEGRSDRFWAWELKGRRGRRRRKATREAKDGRLLDCIVDFFFER